MRSLEEMLESLVSLLLLNDARQEHAVRSFGRASEVAQRLPLVHRTNKPGDEPAKWPEVLRSRTFAASAPCTGDREKAAGIPRAAYFFVGCGAYPDGLVGFVLDAPSVLTRASSYTPFDSGSIEKYSVPTEPTLAAAWDGPAKDRFLAAHVGPGRDLVSFSGPYLASHFHEPLSYVRRGQRSNPDFPAYHGLQCRVGDRRAWTLEVQVHEDVAFGAGGATLIEIVAARPAQVEDMPDDLVGITRVASLENEVLESIAEGIAARILAEVP
jgi:hypothetical protein